MTELRSSASAVCASSKELSPSPTFIFYFDPDAFYLSIVPSLNLSNLKEFSGFCLKKNLATILLDNFANLPIFDMQTAEIPTVWGANLKVVLTSPCMFLCQFRQDHCHSPSAHHLPLCSSLAAILIAVSFLPDSFPSSFCPQEVDLSGMQTGWYCLL